MQVVPRVPDVNDKVSSFLLPLEFSLLDRAISSIEKCFDRRQYCTIVSKNVRCLLLSEFGLCIDTPWYVHTGIG